jgi:hypothetical protein
MIDNESKETNVKATIDAVTGLITAIPIYQDTLQPSAKQIGKSLETVAKTVNIALAPIKALVWGYEKIEKFITERVSEKLENVAPENIVSPPPSIAGPAIEALRFAGEDINLRELYANLLASSMDIGTQDLIHPSYVDIIKNLSSDEAILLQVFNENSLFPVVDLYQTSTKDNGRKIEYRNFTHFSKFTNLKRPDLIPLYLDNICRLGIIEIREDQFLNSPTAYDILQLDPFFSSKIVEIEKEKNIYAFIKKLIRLTDFGIQFICS